jgi:hypothetical protein
MYLTLLKYLFNQLKPLVPSDGDALEHYLSIKDADAFFDASSTYIGQNYALACHCLEIALSLDEWYFKCLPHEFTQNYTYLMAFLKQIENAHNYVLNKSMVLDDEQYQFLYQQLTLFAQSLMNVAQQQNALQPFNTSNIQAYLHNNFT